MRSLFLILLFAATASSQQNFCFQPFSVSDLAEDHVFYDQFSIKWLAMSEPIGHVDLYLNRGFNQPGCTDIYNICSHSRSHEWIRDFFKKMKLLYGDWIAHRPYAYKSDSYIDFITGFSHMKYCNTTCRIPVDLIRSAEEYNSELTRLGFDLEKPNRFNSPGTNGH